MSRESSMFFGTLVSDIAVSKFNEELSVKILLLPCENYHQSRSTLLIMMNYRTSLRDVWSWKSTRMTLSY